MAGIAAGGEVHAAPAAANAGRRRAAGIYGAIITAAILAAAGGHLPTVALVVSVGLSVYGASEIATGHHDPVSVGSLVGGLAVGAAAFLLGRRYYRRRKARRAEGLGGLAAAMPAPAAADEEN